MQIIAAQTKDLKNFYADSDIFEIIKILTKTTPHMNRNTLMG